MNQFANNDLTTKQILKIVISYIVITFGGAIIIAYLANLWGNYADMTVAEINNYKIFNTYLALATTNIGLTVLYILIALKNFKYYITSWKNTYFKYILFGYLFSIAFTAVYGLILKNFSIDGTSTNQTSVEMLIRSQPIILIIVISVFVPIVEEVLFRGAIFQLVKNRFNIIWAFIVSNAVFATLHVLDPESLPFFPVYFGMGIIITFAYKKANYNLLVPIGLHMMINTISSIMTLFPPK